MAKDPAFLFYYSDFLLGTDFMSHKEVGQYIRVLCHLADKGQLEEKQVLRICKASAIPSNILSKLKFDNGFYYQERLRKEVDKRKAFSESRRKNAIGDKDISQASAEDMENRNRNTPDNVLKGGNGGKEIFIKPTQEEAIEYANHLKYSDFNFEKWLSHYECNGWMVGKNKMKDWKASIRYWKTNHKEFNSGTNQQVSKGSVKARLDYKFDAEQYAKRKAEAIELDRIRESGS